MITIALVLHLIFAIALIAVVLLQRSEGGALGIGGGGGGGGGGLVSSRGAASFLTRTTAVLAACFIATSLALAVMAQKSSAPRSFLDAPDGSGLFQDDLVPGRDSGLPALRPGVDQPGVDQPGSGPNDSLTPGAPGGD